MVVDRNLELSHIFHIDLKIDSIKDELDDVTKSHTWPLKHTHAAHIESPTDQLKQKRRLKK